MQAAAELIRNARNAGGLTQAQLAARLGVTQAAIAQLESPRSNPTLATLERALRACDRRLDLRAVPVDHGVDISLIREALKMTPAERIAASERLTRDAEAIAAAGQQARSAARGSK